MPNILPLCACLVIGVALAYAAYTDHKDRVIPNRVPITILICGIFTTIGWTEKIAAFVIVAIVLVICTQILHHQSGGGDLKLYLSLALALGLAGFAIILAIAVLLCARSQAVRGRLGKKGDLLPMAVFIFPAYLIYMAFIFILGRL